MSGSFVGSPSWQNLFANPLPFIPRELARGLTAADIDDLLLTFTQGPSPERVIALEFLRQLSLRPEEQPNVPWNSLHRSRLVDALAHRTRAYFAGSVAWSERGGSIVRALWRILEPTAFVAFAVAQPLGQMEVPQQQEVLLALAATARDHSVALDWLQAAVAARGDLGDRAQDALEEVGIVSPERVAYWSRRWREDRDHRALDWLYDRWLSYLPRGYPLSELLAVLGAPDDGEPPDIYYGGPDGHVYVEAYEKTGFSGCHRA